MKGRRSGKVTTKWCLGIFYTKNKIKIILDERIALLTAIENSKPRDIVIFLKITKLL